MIEFPKTNNYVEVVPCVHAKLPLKLTSRVAIWVESERPEASAYHLQHPYNDKSFTAIKYINDNLYYLDWHNSKYYTSLELQVNTPIGLGLGTHQAPSVDAAFIP